MEKVFVATVFVLAVVIKAETAVDKKAAAEIKNEAEVESTRENSVYGKHSA